MKACIGMFTNLGEVVFAAPHDLQNFHLVALSRAAWGTEHDRSFECSLLLRRLLPSGSIDCGEAASALQQVTCKRPLVENRGPHLT